ncbi:sodium:solute symporter [Cryomorpha ignava]|uniref:Sodium:solute symporter n=1 Tax=Cryomorpha ignava TaxID=101383 RepID=A0A7K3WTK8_9FLAO|nr:sodium:solute symporter [Cryomorpha ignava]NEN23995.1 sodium:solute symporter [Cryomorpha ignava]
MSGLDYAVMLGTLLTIVIYGTLKTRKSKNIEGYFLGDNKLKWGTIGLSVMATQASAITFLSTPGLAFESGMAFVQNYLGLPIALIIISIVFIPIYYKLKVYTAYEYLERRFDLKSRLLAASLFLIQRGLAAGITIYAPAIVLSSVLNWNLTLTILVVGVLVIIYTVSGGSKAVSLTQKWQMGIILIGMGIAFGTIINNLPQGVGVIDGLKLAGKMGKTDAINFSFDVKERYTFWSGITGGLFLALSYFGTDQSQVQRYLGGSSVRESRMGLMFNAVLKIPMQFFILLTGVLVFVFFQFQQHDVLFDSTSLGLLENTESKGQLDELRSEHYANHDKKEAASYELISAMDNGNEDAIDRATTNLRELNAEGKSLRNAAKELVISEFPNNTQRDSDYVFITYILNFMPAGLIGLLLAVILSAAMSSTAGELNALGSTSSVDFYKRVIQPGKSEKHYLIASKWLTALWGAIALGFALTADLFENLIEAVNILGSIFYGTILGIFLVAFFFKFVRGRSVFIAALLAQISVILTFIFFSEYISYLYFNIIGCGLVILFGILFSAIENRKPVVE